MPEPLAAGGTLEEIDSPESLVRDRFPAGAMLEGRYRIVSFLGRGGMGEVYRADDLTLGLPVALKLLPGPREGRRESLERLLDEVRIARRISHPNVCRVHDVGEAAGRHFLSMEYIDGEDLASLLRRIGRLPRGKALELSAQICEGLAAAHSENVVHRDLKPRNLMIDGRGRARITDFGIATLAERLGGATSWGTPAYMAPEQLLGEPATAKSDLYALGLILYELFTGQPVFRSGSRAERLASLGRDRPLPPARLVEGLEPAIEEVILKCLERDPRGRPASASEIALALGSRAVSLPWRPEPGREIPHRTSWLLERQLGEGGFGEVWLARHRKTRDVRVFKLCHQVAGLSSLEREITVFRLLKEELGDRDDIARILDWSFDEPPYFIESEYTAGGDLLVWAEEQGGLHRVPLATRLEIVAQVATALAAAHSVGVLHKDVKPTNVLIAREPAPHAAGAGEIRALLTDFGLGTITEQQRLARAEITAAGLSAKSREGTGGTRLYMAPELLEGKPATLQSDVFALGVMLYQAVLGDFTRALAPGWWREIEDELLREDVAEAVDGSPERRLGDARELARRLRQLPQRRARRESERQLQAEARRVQQALERSRRRRRLGALIIGALVVVAAGMGLLAGQIAREAARTKNIARTAVAGEWIREDPTHAALVLLEVEDPDRTPYAVAQMRRVLRQKLAKVELRGHAGPVLSAAWSDDGERVLTISRDRTVRVWTADGVEPPAVTVVGEPLTAAWLDAGRQRVLTLSTQGVARAWNLDGSGGEVIFDTRDRHVQAVAADPRRELVLTGSWSGEVRLWPTDGSSPPRTLAGHDGPVTAAAFSRDGEGMATASQDGTARVWLAGAADPIVLEHRDALLDAAFDPAGGRLLTASAGGVATIWRLAEARDPIVFEIASPGLAAFDVAWSPDGERVALAAAGEVWWCAADGSSSVRISSGHGEGATVELGPRGERLLIASSSGVVELRNVDGTGEPITLRGHGAGVIAAFGPRGERVLTASRAGTARIWSVEPPVEPAVLRQTAAIRVAAWNRTGDLLATAAADGSVRVWPADGSRAAAGLAGSGVAVESLVFSPVDDRLLVGDRDGQAWLIGVDGRRQPLVGHQGSVAAAAWSRSGDRVATGSDDGTVRVWRANGSGEPVVLGPGPEPVLALAWAPGDRRVIAAFSDGVLSWPVGGGASRRLVSPESAIETVAFAPAGDRLVTVTDEGAVSAWPLDDGGAPAWTAHHDDFVFAAAFNGRGDLLTATSEGSVRMLAAGDPEPRVVQRHQSAVFAVAWSPDGGRFAAASGDGTARIWRLDRLDEPALLEGHEGQVMDVAWSPRGDRLVTVSLDGTARVWRVETPDLIAAIESATRVCLDPELRRLALGDSPRAALERYHECTRARGRAPGSPGSTGEGGA